MNNKLQRKITTAQGIIESIITGANNAGYKAGGEFNRVNIEYCTADGLFTVYACTNDDLEKRGASFSLQDAMGNLFSNIEADPK